MSHFDCAVILPLVVYRGDNGELYRDAAKDVTHAKPEQPDSWEHIEEDAKNADLRWFDDDVSTVSDLVRRCRALAERERGEA